MAGITDTIKSWYKKDATRPFMYAGTIALGGLALSGGFYIAGWLVEQVSFSITALRGLHLTNSFRYMIQNPIFWKGVLLFAGIAFVVGLTISIISALGKAMTGNNKAIGNAKGKTHEKSKEIEKEKTKEQSIGTKQNYSKIQNKTASISKKHYNPFEKQTPNHRWNSYKYSNNPQHSVKNNRKIYNKNIRDFNKPKTFNKQFYINNNNKSKENSNFYSYSNNKNVKSK